MLKEARLAAIPADRPALDKWLASLAVLVVGGTMTGDDAKLKLKAYSSMLEGRVPLSILTRTTLDEAARTFKFLPGYGELAEFLDQRGRWQSISVQRLEHLLKLPRERAKPPAERPRYDQLPEDERSKFDAIMGQWKRERGIGGSAA